MIGEYGQNIQLTALLEPAPQVGLPEASLILDQQEGVLGTGADMALTISTISTRLGDAPRVHPAAPSASQVSSLAGIAGVIQSFPRQPYITIGADQKALAMCLNQHQEISRVHNKAVKFILLKNLITIN